MIGDPSPLVVAHFKCATNKFHPIINPEGKINFGTAENHLMDEEMLEMLNRPFSFSAEDLHYKQSYGSPSFRVAIANFLEESLKISDVNSDYIAVASGASAVLEALSMSLFEDGDGLVVFTPIYGGFLHDFSARFNVKIIPYSLSPQNNYAVEIKGLKEVIENAKKDNIAVKSILICSPHNPLGVTYSNEKLEKIIETAKEYDLDIIVDEIYSQSVYKGQFQSLLEVGKDYRQHIHFVYGFAKDFVLSGFKTGVFYSENKELVSAVQATTYFHPVSTHTMRFLENLLSNRAWIEEFTRKNKVKLLDSYSLVKHMLDGYLGVKIIEANAGIFVWADFSIYLREQTFEAEMELFDKIFNECHVSLSPGQFFKSKAPGWYRICFAQQEEHITTGILRLKKALIQ